MAMRTKPCRKGMAFGTRLSSCANGAADLEALGSQVGHCLTGAIPFTHCFVSDPHRPLPLFLLLAADPTMS